MTAWLQLLTIVINVIYGFILFFITYLNYLFIKDEPVIVKILITLVFMLDYTFIYLIIFYKLTSGIFHIYYLPAFMLGYYIAYKLKWHVKVLSKIKELIDFTIEKLYHKNK